MHVAHLGLQSILLNLTSNDSAYIEIMKRCDGVPIGYSLETLAYTQTQVLARQQGLK